MRLTHFAIVFLLVIARFCAAQSDEPRSATAPDQPKPSNQAPAAPAPSAPPPSAPPAEGQPAAQQGQDKRDGSDKNSGTSNDRLFFTMPNFLTIENAGHLPPLTTGQKFHVVMRSSFDYVQIPWYALLAGISQAQNSEAGYGQGAEGYFKRFGSAFADGTIENVMVGAVLPSLLRQDPRYFQSGQGSFSHRTGYAMSRLVVARSDSGHNQFNYSEILGSAMASAISTYSYHPHEDRTISNTASVWGTQLAYDSITLVIKEFWPDIRRKLKKQH